MWFKRIVSATNCLAKSYPQRMWFRRTKRADNRLPLSYPLRSGLETVTISKFAPTLVIRSICGLENMDETFYRTLQFIHVTRGLQNTRHPKICYDEVIHMVCGLELRKWKLLRGRRVIHRAGGLKNERHKYLRKPNCYPLVSGLKALRTRRSSNCVIHDFSWFRRLEWVLESAAEIYPRLSGLQNHGRWPWRVCKVIHNNVV